MFSVFGKIKNSLDKKHSIVYIPLSKQSLSLVTILEKSGFIFNWNLIRYSNRIQINFRYNLEGLPAINMVKVFSKKFHTKI